MIKGQMVCFSCGTQAAERVKHQNLRRKLNSRRRELEGQIYQKFGRQLSDASAADLGGMADVHNRGSRSFEADTLDNARKNYQNALKRGFTSILDRYHKDDQFLAAMGRMGKIRRNILIMDLLAKAVLPNPGRDFSQRRIARQDAAELNKNGARTVYFPSASIALTQAGLTTQPTDPSFAVMWNGAPPFQSATSWPVSSGSPAQSCSSPSTKAGSMCRRGRPMSCKPGFLTFSGTMSLWPRTPTACWKLNVKGTVKYPVAKLSKPRRSQRPCPRSRAILRHHGKAKEKAGLRTQPSGHPEKAVMLRATGAATSSGVTGSGRISNGPTGTPGVAGVTTPATTTGTVPDTGEL